MENRANQAGSVEGPETSGPVGSGRGVGVRQAQEAPPPASDSQALEFVAQQVLIQHLTPYGTALPFVIHSWLKSFRNSGFAKHIPAHLYFASHHALIERLLKRGARACAAVFADDPDTLIGWMCTEGTVLHYLYVKHVFRRIGIGTKLLASLPESPKFYSHLTYAGLGFRAKRLPQALYNPYAV